MVFSWLPCNANQYHNFVLLSVYNKLLITGPKGNGLFEGPPPLYLLKAQLHVLVICFSDSLAAISSANVRVFCLTIHEGNTLYKPVSLILTFTRQNIQLCYKGFCKKKHCK